MTVVAILISVVLLIFLGYKGWSIVLVAPVVAVFAAVLTALVTGGDVHPLATYTETYMTNMVAFFRVNFPVFMLGAVFGRVMDMTGCAKSIANFITTRLGTGKETLAIAVTCIIITYGGVTGAIIPFSIYPIGAVLYRRANIPKRFLPGAIALGGFSFTLSALPGTSQIQNVIPIGYFGTDTFVAPILGLVASAIVFCGGFFWLMKRQNAAIAKGEGYGIHPNEVLAKVEDGDLPSFVMAILPSIIVVVSNLILSRAVFVDKGNGAFDYLKETPYNTNLRLVAGNWAVILALIFGIIFAIFSNWKIVRKQGGPAAMLREGVSSSFLAIMNISAEVGYGNVIRTLAGFTVLANVLTAVSRGNPLVGSAIATTVMAGVTGSASGGMGIVLGSFAPTFIEQVKAMGISVGALHRIVAVASGGMDTLPHNGAVLTLLAVTGLTHKESYTEIAICTVIMPLIACAVIIALAMLGVN